ncbi:hypothetical protein DMB66_34785 [Actinoplanes sp. ATCC 53533]|uniref:hypothetical protein n=1 Tax=Actinoplanes sp. ATCC 53533 TaxID=1288362 RepID=UPI000F79CDD1|nr:hypothetical protein [Actinoplanes sp. ATCC 53533]RSM55874.1 hypothetical protein DMB66_34785 [Actinoplanes sp. ATCC 53533]
MELETLAEAMARLGALGLGTAIVNVVALRLVRADEVPGWVQVRIRWWSAHNTTFLVVSAAVMAIGLAVLATTAR